MNKNEVWQIITMFLFAILIMALFLGALWLGLKLGLNSQEAMIELKGVENEIHNRRI